MYTKAELRGAIYKLPKSLQMAIATFNTDQTIKDIGEQFHLHIDRVGKLSDEIRDTLFGLHNAADFRQNVINQLQVPPELADQIVTAVSNEIFLKIRELEKAETERERQLEEGEEEATSHQPPVTSQPPEPVFPNQTIPVEIPPIPPKNIFEEKMGMMFNLPKSAPPAEEKTTDPYLEPTK